MQTDCCPSQAGRDSRISGARGAAPCTERSDAKQPGLPSDQMKTNAAAAFDTSLATLYRSGLPATTMNEMGVDALDLILSLIHI